MLRRKFLSVAGVSSLSLAASSAFGKEGEKKQIYGQGDFKYRQVPNWGVLGEKTPVSNGHGIICTREGHVVLLTDHTANNVIIYDSKGKLLNKWGTSYPGAHGLTLVEEGGKEIIYFTDLALHKVFKATLDGEILEEWGYPEKSGKYDNAQQYGPSWTLNHPNGDFYVLDGYGRDYITHYDKNGKYVGVFGGNEGGIPHWGPHGGIFETANNQERLLIAMSDQQCLYDLSLTGEKRAVMPMPGGNPRQITKKGNHYFIAHIGDNWPANFNSLGYVSVLDSDFKVVSNISGSAPVYDDEGKLQKMHATTDLFIHPHDLTVDNEGSVYVAQHKSGNTYPIKLERV